jgi:hypothetical protein
MSSHTHDHSAATVIQSPDMTCVQIRQFKQRQTANEPASVDDRHALLRPWQMSHLACKMIA